MIASVTGRLARKAPDYLVVDVAGVGYQVFVPLSTYYGLPEQGETVSLTIHTHLREESLSLFGFLSLAEKEAFLQLLNVSGIGPKLALAILSSLTVEDLVCSVQAADDTRLCAIPGVGKKTAGRLLLELKDKVKHLGTVTAGPAVRGEGPQTGVVEDALSALVNLGYKRSVAEEALRKARQGRAPAGVEDLIREALAVLIKG